jgi:hypothetical protein
VNVTRLPVRRRLATVAAAIVLAACSADAATPASPPATVPPSASAEPSPSSSTNPCGASIAPAELGELARQGPASGAWVGLNLDWGAETVADATARLGAPPAAVVSFVPFPPGRGDVANLDAAAGQARDAGAVLLITPEPWDGLAAVTDAAIAALVERLAAYGARGVPTIVRFAHEMNGSWYPWGQDPAAYVETYRRVAAAVHAGAPTAGMLWAPNQALGYPYLGGPYQAPPGSAAEAALDTNGDGALGPGDDPYAPFWPGADAVDWVGMSLYHWGTEYPWGENEVPAAGSFAALLTGATGPGEPPAPDFHAEYAERFGKPLAIVETAAFYRPGAGGAPEAEIKGAWLHEVFAPDTGSRFPLLRLVNWFEWRKLEPEVDDVVDWRITADPALLEAFLAALGDGFHLGPVVPPGGSGGACSAPSRTPAP